MYLVTARFFRLLGVTKTFFNVGMLKSLLSVMFLNLAKNKNKQISKYLFGIQSEIWLMDKQSSDVSGSEDCQESSWILANGCYVRLIKGNNTTNSLLHNCKGGIANIYYFKYRITFDPLIFLYLIFEVFTSSVKCICFE